MNSSVAIYGSNDPFSYSGGRIHALLIAEGLANLNYDVYYITESKPVFTNDFSHFPNHARITFIDLNQFKKNISFDLVYFFLVPDFDNSWDFYLQAIILSFKHNSKLVLLSFETPNWLKALSIKNVDFLKWGYWKRVSKFCNCILSSTSEGTFFARRFYSRFLSDKCFNFCHPCINIPVDFKYCTKENQIIVFARFYHSEHKGSNIIHRLLTESMKGYTLLIVSGISEPSPYELNKISDKCNKFNINLVFKKHLTESEKYKELLKSKLLLFPSLFEGFGLPPVEASFCGTPTVAFDLPVLREVNGESIFYARRADYKHFREVAEEVLSSNVDYTALSEGSAEIASFNSFCTRLNNVLNLITKVSSSRRIFNRHILLNYYRFLILSINFMNVFSSFNLILFSYYVKSRIWVGKNLKNNFIYIRLKSCIK